MFGRTLTDHERAAAIHHDEGPPPPRIRLMRGQVVVREETPPPSAVLWTPELGPRQVSTHRGVVLGLGPPARLTEHPSSPEVPHGFGVGSVVQYHFGAVGTQASRTRAWTDGLPATWLTQAEVDAVWVGQCPAAAPANFGPRAGERCEREEGHELSHMINGVPFDGHGGGKLGAVWG